MLNMILSACAFLPFQYFDYKGYSPLKVQKYVWPALVRGFNVVAVASDGKTLAYLPPVLSQIMQHGYLDALPVTNGVCIHSYGPSSVSFTFSAFQPVVCILCAKWTEVEGVSKVCREILGNSYIKIIHSYGGIHEEESEV